MPSRLARRNVARLLVQHGADKDIEDNLGRTPLSMAERNGDSGYDPVNGDVAGSRTIVKAIRAAR